MSNDKSKSLQLAMQEYAEFKNGKSLPAPITERAALTRTPQHADRMLYCSAHQGFAAQMILKLSPGVAEITEVRKLAHVRTQAVKNETAGEDAKILKTHALELGKFQECPHCGSSGIVNCSTCGALSCLGPDENRHHCPCCGRVAGTEISGISLGFAQQTAQATMKARRVENSQMLLSQSRKNQTKQLLLPAPRKK